MGQFKIRIDRNIHFHYPPWLIENFQAQEEEFKMLMHHLGKAFGQSTMQVYFIFFFIYWSHTINDIEYNTYDRKLHI